MLLQANGDSATMLSASGLYLFGFTYLYVGINNLAGLEPQGLGWFSLFVAWPPSRTRVLSFTARNDPVFGVIWLSLGRAVDPVLPGAWGWAATTSADSRAGRRPC